MDWLFELLRAIPTRPYKERQERAVGLVIFCNICFLVVGGYLYPQTWSWAFFALGVIGLSLIYYNIFKSKK
jgi:hypothetical protein